MVHYAAGELKESCIGTRVAVAPHVDLLCIGFGVSGKIFDTGSKGGRHPPNVRRQGLVVYVFCIHLWLSSAITERVQKFYTDLMSKMIL